VVLESRWSDRNPTGLPLDSTWNCPKAKKNLTKLDFVGNHSRWIPSHLLLDSRPFQVDSIPLFQMDSWSFQVDSRSFQVIFPGGFQVIPDGLQVIPAGFQAIPGGFLVISW